MSSIADEKKLCYELFEEIFSEYQKNKRPPREKTQNGYQGRTKGGRDKLDLEVQDRDIRDIIVRFYDVYGRHTGVGQSAFLVHFLLQAMVSFDLDHGHHWGKYGE